MRTSFARAGSGAILLLSLAAVAGPSAAQTIQPAAPAPASASASASAMPEAGPVNFYQDLGGKAGVAAIVADFVTIMLDDKRLNATFEGVDLDRLRSKLAALARSSIWEKSRVDASLGFAVGGGTLMILALLGSLTFGRIP